MSPTATTMVQSNKNKTKPAAQNGTTAETPAAASATPAKVDGRKSWRHTPMTERCAEKVRDVRDLLVKVNEDTSGIVMKNDDGRAALQLVREEIASVLAKVANLPDMLVALTDNVERVAKPAKGFAPGQIIRIKDKHRKEFVGIIPADAFDSLKIETCGETFVSVIVDGSKIVLRHAQIESAEDDFEPGQLVRIKARIRDKYTDCVENAGALDDLTVAKVSGTSVVVRAGDGSKFVVKSSEIEQNGGGIAPARAQK